MKILVTNDDGVFHPNIKTLVEALRAYFPSAKIKVLAPKTEQSAVSHRLNISLPLTLTKESNLIEGVETYSLDSSPADCVKMAIHVLEYDYDLLVSGVNCGLNLGEDIIYSGTVAAAVESALYQKRALAFSAKYKDITGFLEGFKTFMDDYMTKPFYQEALVWNVNFPINPKGIKFAKQGTNKYIYGYNLQSNGTYTPFAKPTFQPKEGQFDTDLACYHQNYITVTPITFDMTDYHNLKN